MKRRSLKMAILIPVLAVLIAGVTLMVVIVGSVASSSTHDLTDRLINSRVNEYSNKFEALCMDAYSVVRSIAPVLNDVASHSQSPRDEMLGVLSSVLMSDDNILAVWTCWEPDAMDGMDSEFAGKGYHDNTGRYVPYVYKSGTGFEIEPLVDYTVPGDGDYYLGARNSGKPYITDPYPYEIGGKTVIIYSIAYPIIRGGTVVGVAGIDISLEELISIMNSGSILDDGYLSVISPGGLISTHRNESMILTDYKS
ncbi:MAG: cache domain-containing protein, partial [Oscillospiraceae bacterium]|nr:cache domain-containing protein [Oscillospiraceae bacterium]